MSSILKALKKLEKAPPFSRKDRSWLKEIQTKEPMSDRLAEKWIAHRRFVAVFAVVLCGLIGAAFVVYKVNITEKIAVPGKFEKQQSTILAPGALTSKKPQAKTTVAQVSVPPAKVQSSVRNEKSVKNPSMLPDNAAVEKNIPAITESPVPQLAAKTSSMETSISVASVPVERNSQTVAKIDNDKTFGKYAAGRMAAVPMLNNEMIKLQAISWSQDPEKRIAVINNRIVRQDGRIEGYFVVEINKDDVILKQDEEMWKIQFRPR